MCSALGPGPAGGVKITVAVVKLLDQVDDEGRDAAVSITHLPQREAVTRLMTQTPSESTSEIS
jgi:hypothetical protein